MALFTEKWQVRTEEWRKKPFYRWLVLVVILVGVFMANLDGSIVNVALPTIADAFGTDLTRLQWIVSGYLVAISSTLLLFGRMADLMGRGKIYSMGILIFVAGSALCGFSSGLGLLILSRVLQALGASMEMANSLGIITDVFPASERGRALGLIGTSVAAGSLVGPPLGGWLVGAFNWHFIFYINVPIGILVFLAGWVLLPNRISEKKETFDLPGAMLFSGGMLGVLLWLSEGERWGWLSPLSIAILVLGIVMLTVFVVRGLRIPFPLLDFSLFRKPIFTAGNVAGMISYMVMFFVTILLPFYLNTVLGYPPAQVGLLMLPQPVALMFLAPLAGWLSDKTGPVLLTTVGMSVIAVGQMTLAFLPITAHYWDVAWRLFLMGVGMALFTSPNNSAVMAAVPPSKYGVAGGVVATVRNVGMSLGVAVAVAIFSSRLAHLTPVIPNHAEAFVLSLRTVYLVGAGIALAGIAVAAVRNASYSSSRKEEPGPA